MIKFIFGENSYESWKVLEKIKNDLKKSNGSEIKIIDGDEVKSIGEIFESSESFSMFSNSPSMIILKRLFANRAKSLQELVLEHIKKNPDIELIIFEDSKVDKRSKLYKYLNKSSEVYESKLLKPNELAFWLRREVEENKLKINDSDIELLISRVGYDQFIISSELQKIKNYLQSSKQDYITKEVIIEMTPYNPEESVWDFIDLLTKGEKGKSLIILETLLEEVGDYQMILGLIVRQLKIIYLILNSHSYGRDTASEIGEHPFVVSKIQRFINKFSKSSIEKSFQRLLNLDRMIKTGEIDAKLGLDLFVLSF